MFRKSFYIVALIFLAFGAEAQYTTGIGIRFGNPGRGLSVIQYFSPKSRGAANFLFVNQFKGYCLTGLYEIHAKNHNEHIELANVGFYGGVGGHAGRYQEKAYFTNTALTNEEYFFVGGFDLVAGVEWKLPHVPLLLSADIKPFLDFSISKDQPLYLDYAATLRYLFN